MLGWLTLDFLPGYQYQLIPLKLTTNYVRKTFLCRILNLVIQPQVPLNKLLAPPCQLQIVNRFKFLSVGFDESLNQIIQTCQMIITVSFWTLIEFKLRYWDSSFIGHTTANDLLQHFTNITEAVNYSSIIHLLMDGASVNHKFYRDMKEYCEREKLAEMINFGSCNLHILHGAFKSGFKSTGWEMKILLKSCYQILHDSPAHRDDYISITKSTKLDLTKHCENC